MKKKLLVFEGGAVLTTHDSINTYQINGKDPVKEVKPTEKNIKKHMKKGKRLGT